VPSAQEGQSKLGCCPHGMAGAGWPTKVSGCRRALEGRSPALSAGIKGGITKLGKAQG